ncbi:MAG: class I SAM-dependent methyltransferase [Elusimicrobiota bacterium]|nr:MAG: class I SAM-dependent methyltransferase [Elusimicrobiota bacterium]
MSAGGDERYYDRLFDVPWVMRLADAPRRAIFDHFMRELAPRPDESVLDLGATSLADPQENMFELHYPHPERVTAAGAEDASFLEKRHPGLRFVRIVPGKPLPFVDGEFDVGFSNAVIEHAGSREAQAFFLAELIRVSKRCFVATPNRWFPVEMHTRLPLVHWLPARAFRAVLSALGLDFYAREENLNLLSAADLRRLLPPQAAARAREGRHYFLGLTSNVSLSIDSERHGVSQRPS